MEKKSCCGRNGKRFWNDTPNMGTILAFITSDIDIEQNLLQDALRYATNKSFNRISVDGQTSTNDMAIVLANGKACNDKIIEKDRNYDTFYKP